MLQPIQQGQPGQTPFGSPGQQQQQTCSAYIGGCPTPTQQQGGLPPQPGAPVTSQFGQAPVYGTTPGANGVPPGFAQPGMQVNQQAQAQSAAANMIQGLLTSPRPGGMPNAMTGGTTLGGGIAGVASKYEADGIMVINDRTAINEWEYIFDINKYRVPPNPLSGTVGTPLNATPIGSPAGTPIGGSPMGTPIGGAPGGPGGMGMPMGGRGGGQ